MKWKRMLFQDPPLPELLEDIREVQRQLALSDARFDMQSDRDLIDACIYEQEALRARYRYLLGQVRAQGLRAPAPYEESARPKAQAAIRRLVGEQV